MVDQHVLVCALIFKLGPDGCRLETALHINPRSHCWFTGYWTAAITGITQYSSSGNGNNGHKFVTVDKMYATCLFVGSVEFHDQNLNTGSVKDEIQILT
jgi:hypothetical protein